MLEGKIIREAPKHQYGWECSCGERKAPYTQRYSQADADLDYHMASHRGFPHEHESELEEEERLSGKCAPDCEACDEEDLAVKRITPLTRRTRLKHQLMTYCTLEFGPNEYEYIKLIPTTRDGKHTGNWRWECSCGARGHDSSLTVEANRALNHVERIHQDHILSVAHVREESKDAPNDLPNTRTIIDAGDARPAPETRSQDPSARWKLFSDDELIAISDGAFEAGMEPIHAQLYEEVNNELKERRS